MDDVVTTSSMSQRLKDQLQHSRLLSKTQLQGMKVSNLAKELRISLDDAIVAKREIDTALGWGAPTSPQANNGTAALMGRSAYQLLQQRRDDTTATAIVTFCKELDNILGGGVQLGEVTEFCGVPGVGKTQLCMQLVLNVQIPKELGGVDGTAAYIDAEGSMVPARLEEMAVALHRHLQGMTKRLPANGALLSRVSSLSPSTLLSNVAMSRVTELGEQMAVIAGMHRYLERHRNVRLVILDSVAFHFRYGDSEDINSRARILQNLSLTLHRIAADYNVAVVVVNQMTTKFGGGGSGGAAAKAWAMHTEQQHEEVGYTGGHGRGGLSVDGADADAASLSLVHAGSSSSGSGGGGGDSSSDAQMVPALGETWAHACTNRVILRWDNAGVRTAHLVKSPSRPPGLAKYAVTPEGVRGLKPHKQLAGAAAVGGSVGSAASSSRDGGSGTSVAKAPVVAAGAASAETTTTSRDAAAVAAATTGAMPDAASSSVAPSSRAGQISGMKRSASSAASSDTLL